MLAIPLCNRKRIEVVQLAFLIQSLFIDISQVYSKIPHYFKYLLCEYNKRDATHASIRFNLVLYQ